MVRALSLSAEVCDTKLELIHSLALHNNYNNDNKNSKNDDQQLPEVIENLCEMYQTFNKHPIEKHRRLFTALILKAYSIHTGSTIPALQSTSRRPRIFGESLKFCQNENSKRKANSRVSTE